MRRIESLAKICGDDRRLGDVVEIGCGDGSLAKMLLSNHDWHVRSYLGIDRSGTAIRRAVAECESLQHAKFVEANFNEFPIESKCADTVIACGVLEHIVEVDAVLRRIREICRAGGRFLATTSNLRSWMYVERRWKERFNYWPYGYQKNYTDAQVVDLLSPYFDVERVIVAHGDWDLPTSAIMDRLGSVVSKRIGRYVVLQARRRETIGGVN